MFSDFNFHHIGIATGSIQKCAAVYIKFGYSISDIKIEPSQKVRICFLSKKGSPLLEIIEPLNEDAPIHNMILRSGTTLYHTCYEVKDIQESIDMLESQKFRLLFEPIQAEAMDEGLFCYLYSVEIGLIELYQRKKEMTSY